MPYADLETRREFHKNYMREYSKTQEYKDKARASYLKRYRTKPNVKAAMRNRTLQRQYGITLEQYEQMKADQNNRCLVCGEEFKRNPHTDHCHVTGKVRGLLCGKCNKGLGQFNDSPGPPAKSSRVFGAVQMKTYIKITWEWDGSRYVVTDEVAQTWDGPVALCCGASQGQKNIANTQSATYNTMVQQAQQVFGDSSKVFGDLMSTFAPTLAAGPNQEGFSQAEKSALQSQAITQTGQAYRNAKQATGEAMAAQGGGNVGDVTGGSNTAINLGIAESAANQTSSELNQIDQADYAVGRQNYAEAAAGLAGAPNVFSPATSAYNAATGSGEAAANTENQIAQQNNSWVSAVTGALGGIAGTALTGGMNNLGKGVGFFGNGAKNGNNGSN